MTGIIQTNFYKIEYQEIHGKVTQDMPLWQNNTIKYYNRIFLKIYKDHKERLLKHLTTQ